MSNFVSKNSFEARNNKVNKSINILMWSQVFVFLVLGVYFFVSDFKKMESYDKIMNDPIHVKYRECKIDNPDKTKMYCLDKVLEDLRESKISELEKK